MASKLSEIPPARIRQVLDHIDPICLDQQELETLFADRPGLDSFLDWLLTATEDQVIDYLLSLDI